MTAPDLDAYHARLTAVAGEYRFLYDEHGEPCGAYPADEDVLRCGCEVQCDTAHDDADNGWDESAYAEWAWADATGGGW